MSSPEPNNPQQGILEHLRQKIVSYSLAYTLVALLAISVIGILPLFRLLKQTEENNLLQIAVTRSLAAEQVLSRITGIARQITSHGMIRTYLAEYRQGTIEMETLRDFTVSDLIDSLEETGEVTGITRLGPQGEIVARIGVEIPENRFLVPGPQSRDVHLSFVGEIEGTSYLLTGTPILDRHGVRIGTDLVLFHTRKLQRILSDPAGLGKSGRCLLGRIENNNQAFLFAGFEGGQTAISPEIRTVLERAYAQKSGILQSSEQDRGRGEVLAFVPVGETGWGLVIGKSQDDLYASVNRQMISVGVFVLLLTVLGGFGMVLLLRPLTGKMLVHSGALEELNRVLRGEISERRHAEERVRRAEREWAQTFEAITDAVAILDVRGDIIRMNQASAAFLKSIPAHKAGKGICRLFPERSDTKSGCPFALMLESRNPEFGELHEPDTDRFFHIAVYPLISEEGELWGGVHLAQDITEQKRVDRLKDEMLSAVSHEMRTPLTAMLGFVEFMIDNEVDREQQVDFLRTVHKETERLNDLVANFLDLQRLQSELGTYRFEPLSIHSLLRENAHLFTVAAKKHRILVDCDEGLPKVRGDEKRLNQVMKNLLSNAIKYSPKGGTVILGARRENSQVVVSVKDEGIGIPPQDLGKVFTRFFRVDDSSRRIPGGIGLGLALVREVVNAHGGRIWVESTLEKGSIFHFTLPVAE